MHINTINIINTKRTIILNFKIEIDYILVIYQKHKSENLFLWMTLLKLFLNDYFNENNTPSNTKIHLQIIPQTPRHYVVRDSPDRPRRAEEQYSYSYNSESTSRSSDPYSRPTTRSYSSTNESVQRSGGPGNYSYSTERSSRTGDGPGSYHSSYSSTASGRLPGGTTYRHYSYRV